MKHLRPQQPRCFGYNDGSITVALSGGTGPYQYSLDNITWQGTNVFNNLTAGSYTFIVVMLVAALYPRP
jgi:hypothetical protein